MSVDQCHDGAGSEILAIRTSRTRDECIIELAGELDLSEVTRFSTVFASVLETDAQALVLDLRELEFLDSTGVHTILAAERLAKEHGKSFVIIRGPRQVQRIFEITGIVGKLAFSDGY
jgi:anti-anti-sigma factor